jgi:P pilus assembly chaperone PapD
MMAAAAATAQPEGFNQGFGITPSGLTAQAQPGGRVTTAFTLSNLGSQGMKRYTIEVSDLGQHESGTVSPVPRGRGARSCADWIDAPAEVQIPAGSSRRVEVSIVCPAGARGAYYAVLNVSERQVLPESRPMVISVRPTVGVTLEVTIPQPAPTHLEPQNLVYKRGAGGTSPALAMKVENTGVWKKPVEGDILVYDRPGQFPIRTSVPYKISGNPYEVYPGMTLSISCPLPRTLKPGTHRVSVRLRLSEKAQARKEFDLEVPGQISAGSTVAAREGEKAELDVNLSVQPQLIEVVIPPGGQRTMAIKVRNEDTRDAHVSTQITQAQMELSGMLTYPEVAQGQANGWLTVSPESFQLAQKRATTVRVKAMIPKTGTPPMPLMGVVNLQVNASPTEHHDDWSSGGEFPVIIVVHEPKASPADLEIMNFRVLRPSQGKNPTAAVLRVKNTGVKVARVYGLMLLERTSGQEIVLRDIGSSQPELILPASEREFRMPLGPLDKGGFRVKAEVSILGSQGSTKSKELTFNVQ